MWNILFGPIYLYPSFWNRLIGPVYLVLSIFNPFILTRLSWPVFLDHSIWTCLPQHLAQRDLFYKLGGKMSEVAFIDINTITILFEKHICLSCAGVVIYWPYPLQCCSPRYLWNSFPWEHPHFLWISCTGAWTPLSATCCCTCQTPWTDDIVANHGKGALWGYILSHIHYMWAPSSILQELLSSCWVAGWLAAWQNLKVAKSSQK